MKIFSSMLVSFIAGSVLFASDLDNNSETSKSEIDLTKQAISKSTEKIETGKQSINKSAKYSKIKIQKIIEKRAEN